MAINPYLFSKIIDHFEVNPTIDLCADLKNRQVLKFYSEKEIEVKNPCWLGVDSFSFPWNKDNEIFYANPPWSKISLLIQKFIKDQTPVLLLVLPYDLLSEEDKKLLEIYSIQPPLEILHNQNTFIPPNLQQPKFNNNNIEVEVKVKGVGSPQTWNQTWVYLVSGKTPSLEVNKIDLDKEIWSETKFDFKGIFNGEELIFNFDTGSSGMIISENTLTKLGLEPEIDLNSPLICFANSSKTTSTKVISMPVEIGGYKENLKFQVLPNLNKEVIIGIPYTFNKNIFIDWKNRVLKFS